MCWARSSASAGLRSRSEAGCTTEIVPGPHKLSIDDLLIRAWQSKEREHAARWPRARGWIRELSADVRNELRRRGFDVEMATALDEQIAEIDGHADVWRIFLDADLFRGIVNALSSPFQSERITKVIGIEARGFLGWRGCHRTRCGACRSAKGRTSTGYQVDPADQRAGLPGPTP
jgi:hypothetical protein